MIFQKENHTKRKNLDGSHGENQKNLFSPRKKYIRRKSKNPTNRNYSNKRKTCKCFICNEEGHIAPQCPKKGKGGKKMIKFLEEQ